MSSVTATDRIVVPPGFVLIFRASRVNPKTGEKEYASEYGLRGFPILVKKKH